MTLLWNIVSVIWLLVTVFLIAGVLFAKGLRGASLLGFLIIGIGGCFFLKAIEPAGQRAKDAVRVAQKSADKSLREASNSAVHSDVEYIFVAENAVKEALTDADSAKFRNVKVYRKAAGAFAVCGEVNSKNRAGGYNGYELFVSGGVSQNTFFASQMDSPRATVRTVCHAE